MSSEKSDSIERKFVDSINIDDYEIETDNGWADISAIHKTIEYQVYVLKTESGKYIECADNHIIFDHDYQQIFAKECVPKELRILKWR